MSEPFLPNKKAENAAPQDARETAEPFQPKKKEDFQIQQAFAGITLQNIGEKLELIRNHSTMENLNKLSYGINIFSPSTTAEKTFKSEVLKFILPYQQALVAEGMSMIGKTQKDFERVAGKYQRLKNDCYTFQMKILNLASKGIMDSKMHFSNINPPLRVAPKDAKKYRELPPESQNVVWVEERKYRKGDVMDLPPGAMVMADSSPFNSGNNHWGIVGPNGNLMHRGSGIHENSMDEFVKNARVITVRVPYGIQYQEQFRFTPQTTVAKNRRKETHYTMEIMKEGAGRLADAPKSPQPEAKQLAKL
jgi:hypothetical protein